MDERKREDVERRINNRFYEHGHPFKMSSGGMRDFALLAYDLDTMSDDEFNKYIRDIKEVYDELGDCEACNCKLNCFLAVYYFKRYPEVSREYLHGTIWKQVILRTKRDFYMEVLRNIRNYLSSQECLCIQIDGVTEMYKEESEKIKSGLPDFMKV